jgi:ProP effector
MENTEKLKNSKEVIAYLVEIFPKCFTAKGEAKPLKIGIFQDLAERLKDDDKVSKTLLRTALRQYTASWRYLHGAKKDAVRVDLDGNDAGVLDAEHIEHAQKTLEESKTKFFAERNKKKAEQKEQAAKAKPAVKTAPKRAVKKPAQPKIDKQPTIKVERQVNEAELKQGQAVKVVIGKAPVQATIVEVSKDGVQVELLSGLSLKVKKEHLFV